MAEFASRGVSNTALGLSIGAVAAELLGGTVGNILGGGRTICNEDHFVTRYDMSLQKEITNKDMEIAYLRGRDASKTDSLEMYKYIDGRFRGVEAQIAQQAVWNATAAANISCMQGNIATLMALTRTVIPNGNICPGWGDVTVSVNPATPTGAGTT